MAEIAEKPTSREIAFDQPRHPSWYDWLLSDKVFDEGKSNGKGNNTPREKGAQPCA